MNQASALPAAIKRRLPEIPGVEWPRPATDAHRAPILSARKVSNSLAIRPTRNPHATSGACGRVMTPPPGHLRS